VPHREGAPGGSGQRPLSANEGLIHPSKTARRPLSLLDFVGVGINSIVGSGVYLLLAPLAAAAGTASVAAIALAAMLCMLIALCFAELAGLFDRDGGPLLYVREAFGPLAGFAVGWMGLVNVVLGYAAVAAGLENALRQTALALAAPWGRWAGVSLTGSTLLVLGLISLLTFVNVRGVKAAAWTSDALSAAKLLPLVLIAGVGLFAIRGEVLGGIFDASSASGSSASGGAGVELRSIASAAFLAVFMLSGFEYVPVPAGEARHAQRTIPIALVGSLSAAALLYCLLQLIALSVLPDLAHREHPLVEVAGALLGIAGSSALNAASLLSMAGFCAGSALVAPHALTALAEAGFLPPRLAARNRWGTPGTAVLLTGGAAAALTLVQDYAALVDVATVAVFAQYIPTCLAVLALRRRLGDVPRVFRVPFGPLIPVLAATASIVLLAAARPEPREWIATAGLLGIGGVLLGLRSARLGRRGRGV
jgi:APA family basic amino acid/polyamine antiporter